MNLKNLLPKDARFAYPERSERASYLNEVKLTFLFAEFLGDREQPLSSDEKRTRELEAKKATYLFAGSPANIILLPPYLFEQSEKQARMKNGG